MPKTKKITINIYDDQAKLLEPLSLDSAIFGQKDNPDLIAQAIRVYLSNQRRAQAKAKNRAEVRGSTKKIWRQKGTGRARHGDRRAPIFVGGGKAHGPRGDQNFKLKLSKKMSLLARSIVLSHFVRQEKIIVLKDFSPQKPQTKIAQTLVFKLAKKEKQLKDSKQIAFISAPSEENARSTFKNLPHFDLLSAHSLNTYQLTRQNFLIFTQTAINHLQKTHENKN
jgi:large subunit ribosomal protein L4